MLHNGNYNLFNAILFWANPLRSSRMRLWMSDCIITQHVLNISTEVDQALFGCYMADVCHVNLLPPRRTFCVRHILQPCTSLQCHFIQNHIRRTRVCLAVACHLRFGQNDSWPGSFTCYRGNTGVERIPEWVSIESWSRKRKFSLRSFLLGLESKTFRSRPSLYRRAIPDGPWR